MKYSLIALLATGATSLNLVTPRDSDAPSVVHFPIQARTDLTRDDHANRIRSQNSKHNHLSKRFNTVNATLANTDTLYFTNATLGTPPQPFFLHVDTGSSDLWVNSNQSDLCTGPGSAKCKRSGVYNANASSTYAYINSEFNITYVDGTTATGDYATDTFTFGNISLSGQQFGIGYNSTTEQGILGLGYPVNEVQVTENGAKAYNNVPATLQAANITQAMAYSLWLNDINSDFGSILFGGVNTAKFTPPLYTVPILKEGSGWSQFMIALTDLGQNGTVGSIASNQAISVLLDSGSSLTYLPQNIVDPIWSAFGAEYNADDGAATIDCDVANEAGSIDFTFSNDDAATIHVNISQLVVPFSTNSNGQTTSCIFGITNTTSTNTLGDTFLRAAYVVYDLSNNEISMANTIYNSTASDNVLEIANVGSSTTTEAVPSATAVPSPVTSVTDMPSLQAAQTTGAASPNLEKGAVRWGVAGAAAVGAAFVL